MSMNITTKGIHLEVTAEMHEYLEKRLRGVEKFLDENARVDVELGRTSSHHKTGDVFRAEINVSVHGDFVRAGAEGGDINTAIDVARAELFEILSSRKDKRQTLWKRGKQKIKNMIRGVNAE